MDALYIISMVCYTCLEFVSLCNINEINKGNSFPRRRNFIMNYIVFDLEWNQSPGGKKWSNSRLPFEIIEIGAVKLNEKKEIVDSFQRLIKPQVYNWIHDSIHEVIHVNYKDLQNGTVFPQAVTEFIEWCGEEYYLPSAMRKTANEELWNLQQIKWA